MKKYNWNQNTEMWECGDGCCSGTNTSIFVNDKEIGGYGDLSLRNYDSFDLFIQTLNGNDKNLVLSYSAFVNEVGALSDAVYLNETLIADSIWQCHMFSDALNSLGLPFTEITYEVDWDLWQEKKELSLSVESEEKHNVN